MSRLKVAILEDNKRFLKQLKMNLEASGLVQVIVFATESEEFIEKVQSSDVQALFLDIDLAGDSMSGLDVAGVLNLPVLFVTGHTKDYFFQIEDYNFSSELPVDHITKTISADRINRVLPKFIQRVEAYEQSSQVRLDFANAKGNLIKLDDIVFIETDYGKSGESGNKLMHFRSRPPERLLNQSFSMLERLGLSKHKFIQPHRSFRVNAKHILSYDKINHTIEVKTHNGEEVVNRQIGVSENYRRPVQSAIKSTS